MQTQFVIRRVLLGLLLLAWKPIYAQSESPSQQNLLRSQADEERIIGNIVVYRDGSQELNWTAPNLTLENPKQGATLNGKQPIKLSIESSNDENFRVSWLVNDGKVKNRRGLETEWEPGGAGDYTMIASARGLKSGGFQFKAVDFKVD
jgi:hypothetical protein